jgi:hypothetical protein
MPRLSEMAVSRHRRAHLLAPARAAAAAVGKDSAARAQRKQQLAAIDKGDALAVVDALFNAQAMAERLRQVEDRLDAASEKAPADGAHQHLAAMSGAQIRALETTARLGSVGGYAAPRNVGPGSGGEGSKFSITILGEKTVSINATPLPQPAVVDGEVGEEGELAPDSGAA